MMEIKILGSGCPKCGEAEERTRTALAELGVEAVVEKITDSKQIMSYGVMMTPGIVINERLRSSGRIPLIEDLKAWIIEESRKG